MTESCLYKTHSCPSHDPVKEWLFISIYILVRRQMNVYNIYIYGYNVRHTCVFFPTLCDIQVKLEMTSMMWVEQLWAVQESEWMFSLSLKDNKVSLAGSTSFQGYFLGELWKWHDSVNTVVCDVAHLWNWAHIHMSFEPGLTADSHAKKWKASLSSQIWDTDHIL